MADINIRKNTPDKLRAKDLIDMERCIMEEKRAEIFL